jgi:CRP-like cAMP-binding protein
MLPLAMEPSSEGKMPLKSERPEPPLHSAGIPDNGVETQDQHRNRLLRALPPHEYARLLPHLEAITLAPMQVLADMEQPQRYVYFPETAVIALMRRMRDGTPIEAGTIGREGMAGLTALVGVQWSPSSMIGQLPGLCQRISVVVLRELLAELSELAGMLSRYTLALMDQLGQTIACNSLHSVEQRCTRWLLMAHDRVGGDEFILTHELLAQMLAVRRAGVTVAMISLQRAGLISYSRGRVTILDRAGLEAVACECHAVTLAHAERLMGEQVVG